MLSCVISKAREGDHASIRKSRSLWWTPCLGQQNITFDTGCVHEVNISVCPIVIINARLGNRKQKVEMSSQKIGFCFKHTGRRRKKSHFTIDTCFLASCHLCVTCSWQGWDVCQTKDLSILQVSYQIKSTCALGQQPFLSACEDITYKDLNSLTLERHRGCILDRF